MMAHVFVLPTSSATRYFSFFVNPPLLLFPARSGGDAPERKLSKFALTRCFRATPCALRALRRAPARSASRRRDRLRFRIHHHLPREPQIHRIDAPGAGAPLIDIFREQMIPVAEIGIAKVHKNRRRAAGRRSQSGERRAHIGSIGKIHFADVIVRAGLRRVQSPS